jgi:hypothetical protein
MTPESHLHEASAGTADTTHIHFGGSDVALETDESESEPEVKLLLTQQRSDGAS